MLQVINNFTWLLKLEAHEYIHMHTLILHMHVFVWIQVWFYDNFPII